MLNRLASLRVWLLAAMLSTAILTLVAGGFISSQIATSTEEAADRASVQATAQAIATQVQNGATQEDLRAMQEVLPNQQVIVIQNGQTVFSGPEIFSLPHELTATAPLPNGIVKVLDFHAITVNRFGQGTMIAGAIALVIIAEAWLAATVLVRTVRRPVARAIEAAGRLADGDFSARMGDSGPEEFARLGRAVDAMAAQLQRADNEQRRFLGDLAHEIATPISAISGFAVALTDGSATTADERAEAASIVLHETGRLQQLLDDVRHLTRLELTDSVRREHVDVGALCEETAKRFRLMARDAGVALTVRASHTHLDADPRLIDAVVSNFVSNAIRYTPSGGKVEIRTGRRRRPAAVVIAVRDTGAGIAPQHMERVFDRLYRTDEARTRATGGSGLGLAIARSAARTLDARIEAESHPGAGSEFRLVMTTAEAHGGGDHLPDHQSAEI